MKRLITILLLCMAAACLFALGSRKPAQPLPFGQVQYIEGTVTATRDGKKPAALDIGDSLYADDLVTTSEKGTVIIELNKSTNISGTITVEPRTALYLSMVTTKNGPQTSIELLSGTVSAKVKKLVGLKTGQRPSMSVRTSSVVAGVRGTEFDVSTSVNDSTLVICSDGAVSCSDGTDSLPVAAGKALEKRPDERFNYLSMGLTPLKEFRKTWNTGEIETFRSNPTRALGYYEGKYDELSGRFKKSFSELSGSAVLKKWIAEHGRGVVPNPRDPSVMREKKELISQIFAIRKILFNYERIYYRMQEVQSLVEGTELENKELKPGMTAGNFIRRMRGESAGLAGRIAFCRFAEKLYAEREEGGIGLFDEDSGISENFSD